MYHLSYYTQLVPGCRAQASIFDTCSSTVINKTFSFCRGFAPFDQFRAIIQLQMVLFTSHEIRLFTSFIRELQTKKNKAQKPASLFWEMEDFVSIFCGRVSPALVSLSEVQVHFVGVSSLPTHPYYKYLKRLCVCEKLTRNWHHLITCKCLQLQPRRFAMQRHPAAIQFTMLPATVAASRDMIVVVYRRRINETCLSSTVLSIK